jgi:hypothetical protein
MGKRRDPKSQHAEGQHGPRTHARFVEQLHEAPPAEPTEAIVARKRTRAALDGKRRLVEDRQQHDEGEKKSERTRFAKEHQHGRTDDGPSDNTGNLHGVTGSRSHRADYQSRGRDGLPRKKKSD